MLQLLEILSVFLAVIFVVAFAWMLSTVKGRRSLQLAIRSLWLHKLRSFLSVLGIIIGTGEWDNTRHESLRLSEILNSKGIQHFLDDRKWCGHEWSYWRDMLPHYLSLI